MRGVTALLECRMGGGRRVSYGSLVRNGLVQFRGREAIAVASKSHASNSSEVLTCCEGHLMGFFVGIV